MLDIAEAGIRDLLAAQQACLRAAQLEVPSHGVPSL
jgi:hypothetical protein